jgi:3',5'-nucleoside bisphosphate phosphatase
MRAIDVMLNIDLHTHSSFSDGLLDPTQLVRVAAQNGVRALALTDHDTLDGLDQARRAAAECDVEFVPGVEISVTWNSQTVHVVGVGIDPGDTVLCTGLNGVRAGRSARAERMAASLAQHGIHGSLEGTIKFTANPAMIGRTHFARYLVEQGHAKDVKSVFKKYLVRGKPGFVAHQWASLRQALAWIQASGGVAVLAHPGRYDIGPNAMKRLLAEFKQEGGSAVEVVTSNHTPEHVARFARYAQEFGLHASRGSDYHGDEGERVKPGRIADLPHGLTPVWTLLPRFHAESIEPRQH